MEEAGALRLARNSSLELLLWQRRFGVLGSIAPVLEKKKERHEKMRLGMEKAHLAGVEEGRRQQWRPDMRQPGGDIHARVLGIEGGDHGVLIGVEERIKSV